MRIVVPFVLVATLFLVGCKPSASKTSVESDSSSSAKTPAAASESATSEPTPSASSKAVLTGATAEAGCATCIYKMKGVTGCKLAVKIEGETYLVEGSAIDEYGDAHADDGLCNTARKATVSGQVKGDKFVASKIELLP